MSTLQTKDRYVNQFDRDCVSREMQILIDSTKYFVAFHFYGTVRNDTEYWRWFSQELEMGEHWNSDFNGMPLGTSKDGTMDISRMRFRFGSSNIFIMDAAVSSTDFLVTSIIGQLYFLNNFFEFSNSVKISFSFV